MKKTYKPMARTEKASQMFKKKTLNVNDDLNIRHDEDDIENVDAYWSTAMSVIGNSTIDSIDSIDDTVVTEQSDTLFNINNIRKSIRGDQKESIEELYRKSVDESRREEPTHLSPNEDSTPDAQGEVNGGVGAKPDTLEEDINSEDFENSIKKKTRRLTLKGNDSSLVDLRILEKEQDKDPSSVDFDVEIPNSGSDVEMPDDGFNGEMPDNTSEMEVSNNDSGKEAFNNGFEMELDSLLGDYSNVKENVVNQRRGEKPIEELRSFSFSSVALKSPLVPQKVESHRIKDSERTGGTGRKEYLEIREVPSINTVNSVKPLVCSSSMDTAIMNLDYLAYVENYETENAFSIYVIKGKAELVVNNNLKTISKGSVAVIEKGDVYSLNCLSKNGALLLLSYAL